MRYGLQWLFLYREKIPPLCPAQIYGSIAVALPLTLGDGMDQMRCVVMNANGSNRPALGHDEDAATYGLTHLCLTMFGKMVAMAASLGLGFVGGQVGNERIGVEN